jgi:signal transduction histidine kinase
VRRYYSRVLVPAASALLAQGGFAVAVMALDSASRGESANLLYVIAVELAMAAAFLAALAFAAFRRRREIGFALDSPLGSATPPARAAADEAWRELVDATKAEALKEIAARESRSRAELDDFLASVHALKTPATALSLMAERAERRGEALPLIEARAEIDELDRVIDRGLARFRLDDFGRGSRVRRFSAAELARSVLRRQRRLFISRGLSVEVSGDFEAESDPDWLAFILGELLSNAAKHARSQVRVELEAAADGAKGGGIGRVDVADDGRGFSPEEALRAFGRSASGDPSSGCLPSPSGYGLYLASEAAKRLGASLAIVPGDGARLRVTLDLPGGPFGELTRM